MRKAEVLYDSERAGILTETDDGEFIFKYDKEYIKKFPDQFLTLQCQ